MMWKILVLTLTGTAALADVNGIPQAIYDHTLNRFFAEKIAATCPEFTFDKARADTDGKLIEASVGMDAKTFADLVNKFPTDRLAADVAAMYAERKMVVTNSKSYCAAGRNEVAAGSAIGSYLKAK